MVDVFKEEKLELLALTETKLKGKRELSWCGGNGIITGIKKMKRAREGMAILLNLNSLCVVVGYGPNEGDGEERNRFWNDMDRTLDSVGNGY